VALSVASRHAVPGYSKLRVKAQAGPIILCHAIAPYALRLKSGRHRRFDGVLFKMWPLDNTGFRGAQSLVPAWTTDNRWRTTTCTGRPLMALFACATKLGSGAYGARHARARPSVMKWVLAVTEPVVIKPSRLKYRGTRPLQFLPLFLS